MDPRPFDAVILGAGGAGLMCALTAGRRGRRVVVIDHARRPGGKILLSGGGRCNFTNLDVSARNFVSENPHFVKSALARFPPSAFLELVERHRVPWEERKHGQLFCASSARLLLDMLVAECAAADVTFALGRTVERVEHDKPGFRVVTDAGEHVGASLVVATGGLSYPKAGATGLGYDLARQFGLRVTPTAPALDGFVLAEPLGDFSGVSVDAEITAGGLPFREALLFTHAGLSGPVALQASLHWRPGEPIRVNLLPDVADLATWARRGPRSALVHRLATPLTRRVAERLCEGLPADLGNAPRTDVDAFVARVQRWAPVPARTVGWHKAEVTRGGVDTAALSSRTMEARGVPGLYFIGEVVDVTGWLGGFNYHWAWASGRAAGEAV